MRDKFIKVYSSVGALIATFANDSIDEITNKKEQLYNPRVKIDEESSTATFDIYKDSDAWFKISGEDKIYEIDGRRYFIYGEPSEIADTNMVHVTLKELWYSLDSTFVQAYNVSGELEFIGEYSVVLMPFSESDLYVNGTLRSNPYTKDNLGYYIWSIIQDSGYTLEYCDVIDTTYDAINLLSAYQVDTEGVSVLENLKLLKELTDCIYKWDTINKTLSVYDRDTKTSDINKWQGFEIREGVNLTAIEKRRNSNITTRVIPYGYDNLVISSVNSGLIYLDDNSYSPKVYAKIIHNPDIQTPHALKVWAAKELAKISKPTVEYEVGFTWRQDEDYAHETFALYDIVRVVYHDKEIGQEVTDNQRIISLEYDVWKQSAFSAKLGDKVIRWEQRLKQSVENSVKSGQVISTSGVISTGSVYYGSGVTKKRLSGVLGGIESSIATIETTADEDRANIELISMFVNSAKGVKTVQEYTPETWDNDYIYYVSQGTYAGYWRWEVSEWVETQPMNSTLATVNVTADRALANVELLAKYTSSVDEIVEVVNTSGQATWDTQFIYYVTATDKFYKHNGTTWEITDNMTTQVASIQTTANANSAKVALVVEQVEGVNVIKTASIVAAINDAGSTITIDADKINFVGFTTFMRGADYLSEGTTTIDGGKITANSITATQIDVSGLITTGALVVEGDLPENLSDLYNDIGLQDADGVVSIIGGIVTADFISSKGITVTSGGSTIFSAIQTPEGGSVEISPATLKITTSGSFSFIDFGSTILARAISFTDPWVTGEVNGVAAGVGGDLNIHGHNGVVIETPSATGEIVLDAYAIVLDSTATFVSGALYLNSTYTNVANTLSSFESRISALEGGCGSCDTCQTCQNTCQASCQSCDTCQTCQSCDACQTCQSGDEPEYDYYVGDTFFVYYNKSGEYYLDLDGFELYEEDSDGDYLLCIREGWCSYQVMLSGDPVGELVELYIGPDPNPCDDCDAYYDEHGWVN